MSIGRITALGTAWGKLMNCSACISMHSTTISEQRRYGKSFFLLPTSYLRTSSPGTSAANILTQF